MRSEGAPLTVVFFGTSAFAVPSLDAMADAHRVAAVITQPDRPAGRGLKPLPSAVKARARERGLHVLEPESLDAAFVARIAELQPRLLACVSYGKILPRALLAIPGMTALNVHPSMLPDYRGAAPIQAALRDGRTSTGVTIIWMNDRMDAGDIALQRPEHITMDDDYGSLHDRCARIGADLLAQAATLLANGALPRTPQDESRATFTRAISKEDLRIDLDAPAAAIVNLIRSASPSPGAWMLWHGKRLKVLRARVEAAESAAFTADGPSIRARDGRVRLLRVTPEGRKPMSGAEFARHAPPQP